MFVCFLALQGHHFFWAFAGQHKDSFWSLLQSAAQIKSDALKEKRPEMLNRNAVVFQQDNARSHTSWITCQKLLQLEWHVPAHSTYSADLAASWTITCCGLCRMVEPSTQIRTSKTTSDSFLPARTNNFMSMASICCPKDGQSYCIKMENT